MAASKGHEDVISSHVESTPQEMTARENPLDILAHDSNVFFTVEEERRVLRKIDMRVLPLMLGAYFLQQLDKSSLSYTSVFNIQKDAGLHGRQYSWLGSVLYIAQLVMQPLGALLLVKLPTGKVISIAIFLWGVTMCGMAGCRNFKELMATRFLLGSFESLIGPSLVAVTQMWWRRSEQTNRTSAWNAMNGITFIFGSLSTYGLGHIKTDKLHSYQIIFLYCGGITLVFSVFSIIFFPDSPMEAKFWKERERDIAIERLRANQMGIVSRKWRWDHVTEAVLDPKTWCWFFLVMAISIPSGGIGTFGPLIVQSFGFDQFRTILFNIPFGLVNIIAILCGGWLATRIKSKGIVIAILALPCIVGATILLALPRGPGSKGPLLVAYYLTSFLAGITPLIFTWHVQNTAGDTKRKVTTGITFIGMCAGNIIGPLLYSAEDKPYYRKGLISNLAMFAFVEVLVGLIMLYLKFLNSRHASMRAAVGKSAQVHDESMMRKVDLQNLGKGVGQQATPRDEDNAFADMTDLKNEDFIYVY
ncbi:major facilitator superfamily domain-containing protein [Amylocarpus encephaloides]|uniref:Major facilitator superfamily domain-containing protein n=1 Tax=Amylocarpus encephaloides TaxID=45428 RepID=A0A9P7YCZ9_9HELO|nr:major facilitator superfamily domain-containing protein [Amylocarpus encephaloides]